MTPKELNKDIKKINSEIYRMSFENQDEYFAFIEHTAKPEFTRLYGADKTFQSMTKESILIMFRLNLRHRFVALHHFGLHIELN
jgi:hypothetical protein